ncbi:MAG: alpha/beta fold hydrolase [Acidimicrobiaceae bacterium]|nr:alpha/beta fold hydrolase [Acidimicrobiaceae bacterium]
MEKLNAEGLVRLPQFSHATVSDEMIYVSGTIGTTGDGSLVGGGIRPETDQTLKNIEQILTAASSSWSDVLKVSVYLADISDFATMNDVYSRYFPTAPPARITVGGVRLVFDARVEMECTAIRTPEFRTTHSKPVPRRTGFAERDGEKIFYEVVGEGGVPLVLCHGAGGNHAVWFQQVSQFSKNRAVITWDHRGYGKSTDHGDLTGPKVAGGDLIAILDELNVTRADIIGQSMGGWSAVGAYLERPDLFRSLVLADSLGGLLTPKVSEALASSTYTTAASMDYLGVHPALGQRFVVEEPELAHLYQSLGEIGTANSDKVIGRLLMTTYDEATAKSIEIPVLCIVGDHDGLFPPAAIMALCEALPNVRLAVIPSCGHSPYYEAPELWNASVAAFLQSIDKESSSL